MSQLTVAQQKELSSSNPEACSIEIADALERGPSPTETSSLTGNALERGPSPTETSSLTGTQETTFSLCRLVLLGTLMTGLSAALINYNKYLMDDSSRFPFAAYLVVCHMASGMLLTSLLRAVVPSLFASLEDEDKRSQIGWNYVLKKVLPIAIFFAASLVLSNTAYLYASVAYLQMLKEANVILVYVFSLAVGLELFVWRNVYILVFILFCTALTVKGELNFSLRGTLIQMACQLCEASRLILQSLLLSGGLKLDALTYNLIVMPLCFTILGAVLMMNNYFPHAFFPEMPIPDWSDFQRNWQLLIPNFALAFILNVTIALFIKYSSALSMVMCSLVKDVMVVVASVVFLAETISDLQIIAFSMQLFGILTWSMIKTFPKEFESGIFEGYQMLFSKAINRTK